MTEPISASPDFHAFLLPYQSELTGLGIGEGTRRGLVSFLERIWQQNQSLNLFSRTIEPPTLIADHLMDSLIALPYLPATACVIGDLGTGGGFPAIPLALCRPNSRFLLYEKSPRKSGFLSELGALCPNIEVLGPLPEGDVDPACELLIARAFKPLKTILSLTHAYYRRGGAYLLYKGRRRILLEEIRTAGISLCDYKIRKLQPVGKAEERHLLRVRKGGFGLKNQTRAI